MSRNKEKLFSVTAKHCNWQYFGASSKGGQNANRNKNYVRCVHPPSGARGEGKVYKSQAQNKKLAFKNMARSKEFQMWLKRESAKRSGKLDEIKNKIERELRDPNITKVEYLDE